ncbi:hypothetical protein P280DRAFT_509083 [Massarina eburnea CBS 473.64]|uniref:STB6-like N-terminal domain-containing protein n=1 Tax=Massarina eburnea CBS 473.64 TaxID=1395130 RepID=A0A6A6RS68_9PLEO|nr:hypothetical protein P280DRAFT_509083 [Massarina eburnea CBS 473.64]
MSYDLPSSTSQREREKELRTRMPRLQTAAFDSRPLHVRTDSMKRAVAETTTAATATAAAATTASTLPDTVKPPSSPAHQRFVLTDHVAFKYLEDDVCTTVLSRRERLEGYETYLVEQWACSRVHPTFIITTYTGDPKDAVWASVISVPRDESEWSPAMRIYFRALNEYHARRKETKLGTLMVTNLNGFPSSLTIIPVPDGDMRKNREIFFVSENLKRLGCSGRLGIKLAEPSSATQAKFHQLYRTSDKIALNSSVIELVKLCQAALVVFGKLAPEYADGLLCDVTEKAINDWWVEFGAEYYTVEPQDGILGPTTVAALLGMLMGARNRLSAYNAPVAKDVFDIESTTKGISYFQKTQRITKSRQLDRQTLERLRRATAKAATKESWAGVPRAFKTTVAELGGKGGEMVMGMVGAGDKAGIADIETVEFDRFVELVTGERAKWLWYGKPRKSTSGDMFSRLPGKDGSPPPEDHHQHITGYLLRSPSLDGHITPNRNSMEMGMGKRADSNLTAESMEKERDPYSKRSAIKRATEKIESGSGFHQIKNKINRRNHQPKPSRDDIRSAIPHSHSDIWSPLSQESSFTSKTRSVELNRTISDASFAKNLSETPRDSISTLAVEDGSYSQTDGTVDDSTLTVKPSTETDESKPPTIENSVAGSVYKGIELNDKLPIDKAHVVPPLLRRTHSVGQLDPYQAQRRNDNWWPRHLSFSIAEESVFTWKSIVPTSADVNSTASNGTNLYADLASQVLLSEEAKRLHHRLSLLTSHDLPWAQANLDLIKSLNTNAEADSLDLEALYYPALDTYQSLREDAHEVLSSNRVQLNEAMRDLVNLGDKLEYEIGGLRSKADDVEDGVMELERLVEGVEVLEGELESVLGAAGREGWVHWGLRLITGFGEKPEMPE